MKTEFNFLNLKNDDTYFDLMRLEVVRLRTFLMKLGVEKKIASHSEIELIKTCLKNHSLDIRKFKCMSLFEHIDLLERSIEENIDSHNTVKFDIFCIEKILSNSNLKLIDHDNITSLMTEETFTEVYNEHMIMKYRSIDYNFLTSHSLLALEAVEFWHLFSRAKEYSDIQMNSIETMIKTLLPVKNPVPIHYVVEIKEGTRIGVDMESLVYAPIINAHGDFAGLVHIFKAHNKREISLSVV